MRDDVIGVWPILSMYSDMLMMEDKWQVFEENRLSWVAHRLRQDVTVGEPFASRGVTLRRVTCELELARDVPPLDAAGLVNLGMLNLHAAGDAVLWLPDEGRIVRRMHMLVHNDTVDWRMRQLATLGIIQLTHAERASEDIAEFFGGRPAPAWAHPTSGLREEPDDTLNLPDSFFYGSRGQPNPFQVEGEFQQIGDAANETGRCSLGGSADGVSIETAWGAADTALVRVRPEDHPHLGAGLLTTILMTPEATHSIPELANHLNLEEHRSAQELHGLGAWCIQTSGEAPCLGHALFLPAVLYQPGVAWDCALNAIAHAEWADRKLHGEIERAPDHVTRLVERRLQYLDQMGGGEFN
jgi:hypothetical protein